MDPFINRDKLNRIGECLGYGACAECDDSWHWKQPQDLSYSDSSGMIPICKACFLELSDERVLEHCMDMWVSWGESDCEFTRSNFPYDRLAKSIKSAREGKGGACQMLHQACCGECDLCERCERPLCLHVFDGKEC